MPDWHWAVGSETGGGMHEKAAEVIRFLICETVTGARNDNKVVDAVCLSVYLSIKSSFCTQISDQLEQEENSWRFDLSVMG